MSPAPVPAAALALLSEGRWFGGLPPAQRHAIVEASSVRTVRRGEAVFREGESADTIHALLSGQLRFSRGTVDGGEVVIHVGDPGLWFGWGVLRPGSTTVTSVVALRASRLLSLDAGAFERLVERDPSCFRRFAELALDTMDTLFRYVCDLPGLSADALLRTRLADLVATARACRRIDGPVELTLSQADLASMVGASRQRLNARLQALRAEGLIELGFRRIVVRDERALRESAARAGRGDRGDRGDRDLDG